MTHSDTHYTYVKDATGLTIHTQGQGLRPVLRYARKSPVAGVRLDHSVNRPGYYAVTFRFDDGSTALTLWADSRVLWHWLLARRSWHVDRVYVAHPSLWAIVEEPGTFPYVKALRDKGTLIVGDHLPKA